MVANLILRSLPGEEVATILSCSTRITLAQRRVVYEPGDPIEHVYFVESGLVSLLSIERGGRAIETAMVGREGLIGGIVALGRESTHGQVVCQVETQAIRMPTADFLRCFAAAPKLSRLVNLHNANLLLQVEQNALCHAVHPVQARFCRWLLQASDRLESDILQLTQEACSQVLGVQRTSVSVVAQALQQAGCMVTRRGKIGIVDRAKLESAVCECYGKSKRLPEYESPGRSERALIMH